MGTWDGGGWIKMTRLFPLSRSGREVSERKPNCKWAPAKAHCFRKI